MGYSRQSQIGNLNYKNFLSNKSWMSRRQGLTWEPDDNRICGALASLAGPAWRDFIDASVVAPIGGI